MISPRWLRFPGGYSCRIPDYMARVGRVGHRWAWSVVAETGTAVIAHGDTQTAKSAQYTAGEVLATIAGSRAEAS